MSGAADHLKRNTRKVPDCDRRMLTSCFEGPAHGNVGQPGPGRTVDDDPARAKFIDELIRKRRAANGR